MNGIHPFRPSRSNGEKPVLDKANDLGSMVRFGNIQTLESA